MLCDSQLAQRGRAVHADRRKRGAGGANSASSAMIVMVSSPPISAEAGHGLCHSCMVQKQD